MTLIHRSHRTSRIVVAMLLSVALLLFVAIGTASAHAAVISATPGIGSTIAQAPDTVAVQTAENMKLGAQNSNLFVYGPDGALVSQGDAKIPLNSPKEMSVTIKPEAKPGVYIVRWITVSEDDGDPDQGAFIFTVNPNASATPTVVAPSQTTAQPTPATTNVGVPSWMSALLGVAGLVIGLGVGIVIGRRRPAPDPAVVVNEAKETEPSQRS